MAKENFHEYLEEECHGFSETAFVGGWDIEIAIGAVMYIDNLIKRD